MADYEALKNKQTELIRKALDGSAFIGDIDVDAIGSLTQQSAAATAGSVTGTSAAVNVVTGGLLVVSVDGVLYGITLADGDTPANVVTKANAQLGSAATASLAGSAFKVLSASTGTDSVVKIVSGAGTILANLFLTAGQTGRGQDAGIELATLPLGYDDLGWLTEDGMQFSRDVSSSEVTSFGSVSPTRTDVVSDTTTLQVTAQETKLLTIGLATGADLTGVTPDAQTGEVSIAKPSRPKSKHYRVLTLAVDQGDGGGIYIGRFLPRAKVTSYSEQSFANGDAPVTWGVTFTGEEDSALGYSERWIFGGPGWNALLTQMGF